MKTIQSIRSHNRGISYPGLMLMLVCLSLAGICWLKASSLDGRVQAVSSVADQPHTKNIEDIKAGELVWAYDPMRETWQAKPVIRPLVHDYAGDMVSVSVGDQTITSTGNHPYWVVSGNGLFDRLQAKDVFASDRALAIASGKGRWIEARKLQAGDLLVLRDGRRVPINEIQISYARQKVYNLQVADLHTYAVSNLGVAVHNKCCFPPGTLILMGDGSLKPIEQIELGDQVMAGDPLSRGPPHAAQVIGLIRDFAAYLVDVRFKNTSGITLTITSTLYHPFWTNNRGWVEAKDLGVGDNLNDATHNGIVVAAINTRPYFGRTYNFEVAAVHTYYALADDHTPVLVHNAIILHPYEPVPTGNEIVPYYPSNYGFSEGPGSTLLNGGDTFQRFGPITDGEYISPVGTPPYELSLMPGQGTDLSTWQVTPGNNIPVDYGPTSPANGMPGGGTQMRLRNGQTLDQLYNDGKIVPKS